MTWISLGIVTPNFDSPMFFLPSTGAGEIFKIDFPNAPVKNYSFGWLNWQFQGSNLPVLPFTDPIKLLPIREPRLLFLPFPSELRSMGYSRRQFSLKKSRKDLVFLWQLRIEELISETSP